jgi:hypothetical protein
VTRSSDSQLVVQVPAGSPGAVSVTVVNPIATSNGVQFTYTQVTPPPKTGIPNVTAFAPILNGKNRAGLTGAVNPEGLPTTAYYVYGLDAKYQPFGITTYNLSTAKTTLPGDFTSHSVSATISGLQPGAVYHVRLIANNGNGQMIGPDQTFKAPSGGAPPPPIVGRKENVKPTSGTVFVLEHGQLVPLTQNTQLPTGTVIDTLHGSVSLVAASGTKGKKYTGTFGGAIFKIGQIAGGPNKGLTTLSIVEGANIIGAPSYAACTAPRAASAHAALSSKLLQTLRSRASGRFRSRGRYAAGTVRGTQWSTTDRCDGTVIAVQIHAVQVTDLVKHITIVVHAGHRYLALAHPPKQKKHKKHK